MPTPTAYATRADLYAEGLRPEMLVAPERVVEAVDVTANTIRVRANGFALNDPLELILGYGAAAPAPLAAGTVYYAIPVSGSDDLAQLAATPNGAAIDITGTPTGVVRIARQLGAVIDSVLMRMSSLVDEALIDYGSPLAVWPPIVTSVVCALAAETLAIAQGLMRPEYLASARETLFRKADLARATMNDWRKGKNLIGFPAVVDQTPITVDNESVGWGDEARCWSPEGMI